MIDKNKIYSFEECANMLGKTEWYFKRRVGAGQLKATAIDPKHPWQKAIYGIDLIRFLSLVKWGREYLTKCNIDIHSKEFRQLIRDEDKKELERKLEALKIIEEKHSLALNNTRTKIKQIQEELKKLEETQDTPTSH